MAFGQGQELAPGDLVARHDLGDQAVELGIVLSSTGSDERPGIGFLWGDRIEMMPADDVELLVGTVIFFREPATIERV